VAGAVPTVANPIRMSETPVTYEQAPPTLGEHTRHVLVQRLGMHDAEIDALKARGIV
jgi:crotonobetainyl-CoA:carnitine CoA-transferase CaiB-like acyl-CoA transferase